jgi:putative peptidoglycan lipid II flippase
MTRPTRPPGPPPPDDPPSRRPTFTPRQPPPQSPPQSPPSQGPPPGGSPAGGPPRPTFTPRQQDQADGNGTRHAVSARGEGPRGEGRRGRHGDNRPRPTFTPREGYLPPPDRRQRAPYPPPTAFLPPPGYPQQSYPQPLDYPEAPPRRPPPPPRRGTHDRRPPNAPDQEQRTHVLPVPGTPGVPGPETGPTGPQRTVDTQPNLARSSKAMAIGTIASRGTGFMRTFVLAAVLGTSHLADAYNNSNTLPNTVYFLMLGGIFTSVVVPLLVRAAKNDPDRGEAYAERIFTLAAIALLIVTVVATLLAVPIVDLYSGGISGAERHVMVLFAYFFIPQIFFYGMDSLLGAILNVRGRFGPNMWTPVINNVVVIVVFGLFAVTEGLSRTPENISPSGIRLLGIGTTLGIVIQSIALFPIVRRAGFSFRLRFDFKRAEVGEIGGMAVWMLGYVVSQWAGNLILQIVANVASTRHGATPGTGYSAYSIAWQLFQLPYAIVGISVISALLPRMSGHATDRRYSLVRDDFSTGVRLASVIVVPAAIFLAVLGAPLCEFLFSYGSMNPNQARYVGEVFGVFSLGLVPYMLTQLQLRVFYSFHENRTPALIGMMMLLVGVIGDFVALSVLPPSQVVIGLGVAYGAVTLTGAVLSWPLLLRRVGSLDGWRITRSLVRMLLATIPGLVFIFVTMTLAGSVLHQGAIYGLVSTVIGGGGALLLYAFCCRVLGIGEFRVLVRTAAGRLGR